MKCWKNEAVVSHVIHINSNIILLRNSTSKITKCLAKVIDLMLMSCKLILGEKGNNDIKSTLNSTKKISVNFLLVI